MVFFFNWRILSALASSRQFDTAGLENEFIFIFTGHPGLLQCPYAIAVRHNYLDLQ